MPHLVGIAPEIDTLCRKSRSDGPHEPERSRGSLLMAVNVVEVRAKQQPKDVLSSDLLYVYEALSVPRNGSAAAASNIAVWSRPSPVFVSSSTRPSDDDTRAFALSVWPCASIVDAGTKTARSCSLPSVNAGVARRLRSVYM